MTAGEAMAMTFVEIAVWIDKALARGLLKRG